MQKCSHRPLIQAMTSYMLCQWINHANYVFSDICVRTSRCTWYYLSPLPLLQFLDAHESRNLIHESNFPKLWKNLLFIGQSRLDFFFNRNSNQGKILLKRKMNAQNQTKKLLHWHYAYGFSMRLNKFI